jgi:multiple sugar transport system permease protein
MSELTPSVQPRSVFPRIHLKQSQRENLIGWAFVSPWVLSMVVFIAYPMVASFFFAMTDYNVLSPPKWVGMQNFIIMFTKDPLFWISLKNTLYYVMVSVPLGLVFGLILALLLNQQLKGIGIYRTIFYLPGLVPAVASTLLWMVLLDPQKGLVNEFLGVFGIAKLGWLRSAVWAKPALILMSLWGGTGGSMIIFLAALKEIPQSLHEAAMIDGASTWQRFVNVTLPMISPTILFNLIMSIIGSFQVFASAFVAGGTGAGPLNSLLMYMLHLYRYAFRYFNMGYASAMALSLFIVLIILTLLVIRSSSTWVYYETLKR